MFFGASHDIKSVIWWKYQLIQGENIYILGIAMFVVSSRGIKCVIGMAIATNLGETHFFLVLQCLSVHHMISNLLPPYRFLHDEHYIDYIITFFL